MVSELMQAIAVFLLIALAWLLPWIPPFTDGPSTAAPPLVLVCAGLLLLLRGLDRPAIFARATLLAAVLSAVAGVLQYFGAQGPFEPWVSASQWGVAYGNLRQRNQFASLMGMGLLCVLYLAHQRATAAPGRRAEATTQGLLWWGLGLGGALVALGAALSTSRTGLVQWLGIALCVESAARIGQWRVRPACVWMLRWCLAWYLAALWWAPNLLAAMAPVAGELLLERLQSPVDCNSRLVLWSNVWELVLQKPWWGWGWGELDYAHFSTMFTSERFCSLVDNAHNLPLHLAVELGLVLALCALGVLAWWVWRARPWRERDPERLLAWGILGLIAIHSLLEFPLWYGPFQLTVFWCVWVLLRRKECAAHPPMVATPGLRGRCRQAQILLAGLLLGLASVLAWDYARVSQVYRPVAERWALLGLPQRSVFFQDYLDFARFTTTELSAENAAEMVVLGQRMLHFSPEARVVVKLLEAAQGAGRDDLHQWLLPRFEAAYPADYAAWRARQAP